MADEVVTKKINLEVDISGTSSVAGPNRFHKWIEHGLDSMLEQVDRGQVKAISK